MKRVLVVDDDSDILDVLEMVLGRTFEVHVAEHGKDALAMLERMSFDAIVLDLMMPVLDGFGVIAEIRRRGLSIAILVASAMPDLEDRAQGLGVDVIGKPFSADAVHARLAALLSGGHGGNGGPPPGGGGPVQVSAPNWAEDPEGWDKCLHGMAPPLRSRDRGAVGVCARAGAGRPDRGARSRDGLGRALRATGAATA